MKDTKISDRTLSPCWDYALVYNNYNTFANDKTLGWKTPALVSVPGY